MTERPTSDRDTIVLVYPGDAELDLMNALGRDGVGEPLIELGKRLRQLGYRFEQAIDQSASRVAGAIFWNMRAAQYGRGLRGVARRIRYGNRGRDWKAELLAEGIGERMVLVLREPPCRVPENYDVALHRGFGRILTWRDDLVDGTRYLKLHVAVPVGFPANAELVDFADKKLLVCISANKFSSHPLELYSERRDAVEFFAEAIPDDFDVYGRGWDCDPAKTPQSYRGVVPEKWPVYRRYRFALAYENCADMPGLIAEQGLDCLRSDCVPVYLGAPNVCDYIDPECYVDRREFRSNEQLLRYLESVGRDEYERYRSAISRYLGGESFARFLTPAFVDTMCDALRLEARPLVCGGDELP
jgi:hypothetical protein